MKKTIIASLLVLCAAAAQAREYALNPDRVPSIGLSLEGEGFEGETKYPSAGVKQDSELGYSRLTIDTRLPLSNSFTLELALGSVGRRFQADATPFIDSVDEKMNGGYFRIGGRYYFNRRAR
jgi:opacity protein-like surface antigen